jgi:hypothetical protein
VGSERDFMPRSGHSTLMLQTASRHPVAKPLWT